MRALIADDEPLMRAQLKDALGRVWPSLEIAAEAASGTQALARFEEALPDVAFLDIRMPGPGGIEVAAALHGRCHVVFVTAYDQFAIQAFERNAVDYLLKPVGFERLEVTRRRLEALAMPRRDEALLRLAAELAGMAPKRETLRWLQASVGTSLRMIAVDEVLSIEADDKYTVVQSSQGEALLRMPLRQLAEQLDPGQFWQIHRSTLVRVGAIDRVDKARDGRLFVVLKDGRRLEVSRSYAHRFRKM
ncbi:LytR/AlgR family response regulator transcription factor [Paludibacterium paludis]|uniref:DNA-binding response regulator n=1 Tax=Paludibacterium paludis TaxID=1225769 RepID=A0A918P1Z0_9NEIS|nr:LytTR family DNA-binding domain-containing protein [Paludibacterium paludis]GGY13325.1 DNA-binding response regulator [Paludibacterium paludis]